MDNNVQLAKTIYKELSKHVMADSGGRRV